ncbi:MAG: hypothetical protein ACRDJH_12895 [Thermomicrobiales bacterium]
MIIVAGLSLKNLHPRVWDAASPYFLDDLQAVMVSYSEFHQMPARRRAAMERGLSTLLDVPDGFSVYLDNGAFYFLSRGGETEQTEYEAFVERAKPDWYPIAQDYIPSPKMSLDEQRECLRRTMVMNRAFERDGFVPVIHISQIIEEYIVEICGNRRLSEKPEIALGGIVPNLLRMPKARPYREVIDGVRRVREAFADKRIHLFGVGGTATLHLARLLGMDSVDSSGWRNRAARGIVQLPGRGDRLIAPFGKWRGRAPSETEWELLDACLCPACRQFGREGLLADRTSGFSNRATHNLWILLEEVRLIDLHLTAGTYVEWYKGHLDNSIYLPLIEEVVATTQFERLKQ